jgi:hypothetical protein
MHRNISFYSDDIDESFQGMESDRWRYYDFTGKQRNELKFIKSYEA